MKKKKGKRRRKKKKKKKNTADKKQTFPLFTEERFVLARGREHERVALFNF